MPGPALFAYQTSRHSSTGLTLLKMVFGREARLPIDVEVQRNSQMTIDNLENKDEIDMLM